ncbi:MAG: WG repeat-containing protein, partial [Neisseriaceae bacterium]|nr:WG repeat-containing protein [Neisseriaceae bacterium]
GQKMRFSLFFSTIFTLLSSTISYAQDCVKPKIYGHSVECLIEDRAVIHTYQGYGFADETGKIVIPMQYDKAWSFKNGLAKIEKNKRYGLIDKSGKIISDEYDFIGNIDYGFAKIKQKDKYGLMDKNGKIIIPCEYDDILTLTKEPDLIAVKKDNQWGFVDKNNSTIIPFVYEQVWNFHNGFAKIRNNQQYGIIDLTGKIIIPASYQWLSDANEQGVMVFKQDNLFGLINKDNQIVREAKSEKIADFNHIIIQKQTVSINKTVEENSPQEKQADNMEYDFEKIDGKYVMSEKILANRTTIIKENNQYGLINTAGKIILPMEYDYISVISEDRFKIQKNKQYGIADSQGNILLPPKYAEIFDFEDGLATVKKNEKNGVVDLDGKIIVPAIYDKVYDFENGLAEVENDNLRGLINVQGEIVVPVAYYKFDKKMKTKDYINSLTNNSSHLSHQTTTEKVNNKQEKNNEIPKDKEYLNHLKEIERFRKSNQ